MYSRVPKVGSANDAVHPEEQNRHTLALVLFCLVVFLCCSNKREILFQLPNRCILRVELRILSPWKVKSLPKRLEASEWGCSQYADGLSEYSKMH